MDKESGRKQKSNEDKYVSDKRRRKREREGREKKQVNTISKNHCILVDLKTHNFQYASYSIDIVL